MYFSLMQNIGLKMYQPWYNIQAIFMMSKYYADFRRSLLGIDTFIRMVRHRGIQVKTGNKTNCPHIFHAQLVTKRVQEAHAAVVEAAKMGLEPDVTSGRIPKPDNYMQHCVRLVEGKLLTYEEMIAETKTMLAGVGFERAEMFMP